MQAACTNGEDLAGLEEVFVRQQGETKTDNKSDEDYYDYDKYDDYVSGGGRGELYFRF